MRAILALSAAAMACGPGMAQRPTAAAGLCPNLKKVVAAASATPMWKGVARGAAGLTPLGAFTRCSTTAYSGSADYNCDTSGVTAANVDARYTALVAQVSACLATQPTVQVDAISTYTTWTSGPNVTVTATKVKQAAANNFSLGLGVRNSF